MVVYEMRYWKWETLGREKSSRQIKEMELSLLLSWKVNKRFKELNQMEMWGVEVSEQNEGT